MKDCELCNGTERLADGRKCPVCRGAARMIFGVEAYAEPFDRLPEAVFEVAARSKDEAENLVKRDERAKFYRGS
jgi:hypothetical protein